ncbi:hypothetical protein AN478_01315 [Thiohalorhabdus denitrificans]|uniref:ArnR1-like winged helix-turn-helix domain-containing protein n=1 Tax=Thiohalorhabdus denitrificans TaxID=381306 RepID=A0A0P9C8U0_9GAMM|nr:hypothetical protein [Thiohalorhabdus denitrificans]KPV41735.1 hypothetical protein AN478_01315 [Thiohalorhabdus denitrificans]SCY53881.1 hypothetical protein SAMN05661077_2405 [Thiohalorhabdus denitrificans]
MALSERMILEAFSAGEGVAEIRRRCVAEGHGDSQELSDMLASLLHQGYLESTGEGLTLSKQGRAYLESLQRASGSEPESSRS